VGEAPEGPNVLTKRFVSYPAARARYTETSRNPSLELRLRLRQWLLIDILRQAAGYVGQVGTSIGLTTSHRFGCTDSPGQPFSFSGASPYQGWRSLRPRKRGSASLPIWEIEINPRIR
jgi:hypothetical protein